MPTVMRRSAPPPLPPEQPEFFELSKFVMKAGSFSGKLICQVPEGHLRWLSRQHIAKSTKQIVARYIELMGTCKWVTRKTCRGCGATFEDYTGRNCPECGSAEIVSVRQPLSEGEKQ
jgi:uncharacterized protein (DUF3820 family)/DNA-directed RNA polymerase subunit RPC12/RpoP